MDSIKLKYLIKSMNSGGTPTSSISRFYDDNGIPWVSIGDMSGSPFVYDTYKKITEAGRKEKNLIIFPTHTILYSIYATLGKVSELMTPSTINQAVLAIENNPDIIDRTYFKYSLQSLEDDVNKESFSSTISNLSAQKVLNLKLPVCTKDINKQAIIAKYLDKKCSSTDKLMDQEKIAIEELRNLAYRTISERVSFGTYNKTELVPSRFSWIKYIPKQWGFGKINQLCYVKGRIGWQGLKSNEYKNEGPYLITGTDFCNGLIDWSTCEHITIQRYNEAAPIKIKEGDLLITKDGTVGKVAIVKGLNGKASLNSGVLLIRNTSDRYITKYLYYVLKSSVFWDWFNEKQKGNSTIIHLYQEQFSKFVFPLPPIDEQKEIVNYLDEKCLAIEKLIHIKEGKIEALKLYKKSLVYECVTGRKKVPYAD